MSSRPEIDKDYLDLYIGWCLKYFASHAPVPRDGKQRLLKAAATYAEAPAIRGRGYSSVVFRALGHALLMLLILVITWNDIINLIR